MKIVIKYPGICRFKDKYNWVRSLSGMDNQNGHYAVALVVFLLATFTMTPHHALFLQRHALFSESTLCALHFGKKLVKIRHKIRKLQDFLLEVSRNKFGKVYEIMIMTSTVVDCFNPLFIVT